MNINENKTQSESQCKRIAAWLKKGYSITSLEALNMFGCLRLSSRIWDLKEMGMNIGKKTVVTATNKRVCEYFLIK
jgi:hypothetical protein